MGYKNYSIKNFNDAKNYLDSFINYEKKDKFPYQKSFRLSRVEALLAKLNIDCHKLKTIHIAGTKGKGSTATFCAYVLAASGYKVGLYTSPHFFDFRERIQILISCKPQAKFATANFGYKPKIKNYLISKKDIARITKEFQPCLEKLRFDKKLGDLSFFEVYTAIAFKYFLEKKLDFVVLETGLGGRLDATNVARPLVSIITHIGYDHTDKLGRTLAKIAAEKAGIIKKEIPVVSSLQRQAVYKVIAKRSKKMNSRTFILGRDFKAEEIILRDNHTIFDFKSKKLGLSNLKIYLKGKCQVENASLALAAVSTLKERGFIDREIKFKPGLASAFITGRFETALADPLVVLDVAHNPSAFYALKENLELYFPSKKIILIFAAANDKDIKTMLKILPFSKIIITTFNSSRAFMPQEIKALCRIKNALIAKDIKEAFAAAKTLYKKDSLILISGSLFLVSEAKKLLQASSYRPQAPSRKF